MDILEIMNRRHSVRQYVEKEVAEDQLSLIREELDACNSAGDLHFQLVCNEPRAFGGIMAKYGKFEGVRNYIAVVGRRSKDLDERCGYYGERIVMLIHTLGLQSCWVGLHYKKIKEAFSIDKGEKLVALIAFGHGRHRGLPRKSKSAEDVSNITQDSPEWFVRGVKAALTAPTAVNQQKFFVERDGDLVQLSAGTGFYTKVDLGIVRYHFELGAGSHNFSFKNGKV